jgi:hypothetical protein
MNNISLVLATYNPDIVMLNQALEYGGMFNEVVLHINHKEIPKGIIIPKNCNLILQEEKCTVQEALNICVQQATSSYILPFTDDDFFYHDTLYYLLYHVYMQIEADVVHYPIWSGNEIIEWRLWGDNPNITFDKLIQQNLIPFSSIYKKELWQKIGGYKDVPFSDWFFWLEALKYNPKFLYINKPIYFHREGHKETLANKELNEHGMEKIKQLFIERLSA